MLQKYTIKDIVSAPDCKGQIYPPGLKASQGSIASRTRQHPSCGPTMEVQVTLERSCWSWTGWNRWLRASGEKSKETLSCRWRGGGAAGDILFFGQALLHVFATVKGGSS